MKDLAPREGEFLSPIHELFKASEERGDHVLLKWEENSWTLNQFLDAAKAIAFQLREIGIKEGDRVAIIASNTHKYLAIIYAIWLLNAVEVSINSELRGTFLKHVLDDSEPKIVIGDNDFLKKAQEEAPGLKYFDLEHLELARHVDFETVMPGPSKLASILYTSGTTGPSKGVMIPHGFYVYYAKTLTRVLNLTDKDTCYFTLPFFHVDAHIVVSTALVSGSTLSFAKRFSVSKFWNDFEKFGATWFGAVGSMLSALITQGRPPKKVLESLRLILAAPVPEEAYEMFEDEWGVPVLQMYGQTEGNGPLYSTFENNRRGSLGIPCAGFQVKVDEETGELLTKPTRENSRTLGYWKRPDADAEAFQNGWFHTGDIVRQDEDGFVWYLGRMTDSLRRRGENISAFELETALQKAEGVKIAAALPVRDELGGEDEVKAVLAVDQDFNIGNFLSFCEENLPRFAVPRYLETLDESEFVRGAGTGSIQKHLLPQGINQATIDLTKINK